ncbi:MAG: TOBE domain-containing protein, partial [Pseudomonadota bacterium]
MNHGIIQQQGSPEDLFKNPVNKFVAGFIGSPTMNFLDGEVTTEKGKSIVKGDGYSLPLPDRLAKAMDAHTSKSVMVGVRPSSFTTDTKAGAPIDLRVTVSEYLGSNSVLVTHCGDTELLVEVPSDGPVKAGTSTRFSVKTDEIMLFDRETEQRI